MAGDVDPMSNRETLRCCGNGKRKGKRMRKNIMMCKRTF